MRPSILAIPAALILVALAVDRLTKPARSFENLANGAAFLKKFPDSVLSEAVNDRLNELAESLYRLARAPVRLTGSGSAFFQLFGGEDDARGFARRVRNELGLRAEAAPLETR